MHGVGRKDERVELHRTDGDVAKLGAQDRKLVFGTVHLSETGSNALDRGRGDLEGVVEALDVAWFPHLFCDLTVATDARGDSGLLLMAAEQSRVLSYYVPALGPAPRWCSFLDVITEELEEEESPQTNIHKSMLSSMYTSIRQTAGVAVATIQHGFMYASKIAQLKRKSSFCSSAGTQSPEEWK